MATVKELAPRHTPGPWEVNTCIEQVREVFSHDDVLICDCGVANFVMERGEVEANARLIAAAPELLEALRAVLEAHGTDGTYLTADVARTCEAAIAKAEGRTE